MFRTLVRKRQGAERNLNTIHGVECHERHLEMPRVQGGSAGHTREAEQEGHSHMQGL